MRLIRINVNVAAGQLEPLDHQLQTPLDADEEVEWQFVGLPNNCYPAIKFGVDGAAKGESPGGPFAFLRQTTNQLFGSGRSGTGQRDYLAMVLSSDDHKLAFPPLPLEIGVASAEQTSSPLVVVTPEKGTQHDLTVTPEYISIVSGTPVVWLFQGFKDSHWHPQLLFQHGPDGCATWPYGPFTSLTTGNAMIVGSGNNRITGDYIYDVVIVDNASGKRLRFRRTDPGIGNNGDPAGGGSG